MKLNRNKAFTLIEMLIVVVIIGIILSIVIPSVSKLLNNRSKKIYETHIELLDKEIALYLDQYKGELSNKDDSCFNINYQTLVSEGFQESEIKCKGNIIVTKANNDYENSYYLTCTDSEGNNVVDESKSVPSGCIGFNGKFKMNYKVYSDSSKTTIYDGSSYIKDAYVDFSSTSPYAPSISHYEYSINLDGNWKTITSGTNLGTIDDIKNHYGTLYVRSVDTDGNTSENVRIPLKMDNNGPTFSTSIAGTYLEKTISISNVSDKGIGKVPEFAYSFDGGNTWVNSMSYPFKQNKTVNVCVKDILENKNCKDVEITGIDDQKPTIVANNQKVYITTGTSKAIKDYFTVTYSSLGGSIKCDVDNTSELEFGLNTVTCTAIGNNTLTASASIVIAHQYNATAYCSGGRTLSNGSCTYSYTNNESKCGCSIWNSCQTSACGTTNYSCATEGCGVASYNTCQHSECGADYTRCKSWGSWTNVSCKGTSTVCNSSKGSNTASIQYQCATVSGCGTGCMLQSRSCTGRYYATCATAGCGVASYNTCPNSACGSYNNTCANANCGCKTAASCTVTENEYRYYQCVTTGNNGTTGTLNGSTCSF